jgi:hypothetical protein
MSAIETRIDKALERARQSGLEVSVIQLTEADRRALTRTFTHKWREQLGSKAVFHPTEYGGHRLRTGPRSLIASVCGSDVRIPRRLG